MVNRATGWPRRKSAMCRGTRRPPPAAVQKAVHKPKTVLFRLLCYVCCLDALLYVKVITPEVDIDGMVVDDINGGKMAPTAVGGLKASRVERPRRPSAEYAPNRWEQQRARPSCAAQQSRDHGPRSTGRDLRCRCRRSSRQKQGWGALGFRPACHHECGGRQPPQTRTVMKG